MEYDIIVFFHTIIGESCYNASYLSFVTAPYPTQWGPNDLIITIRIIGILQTQILFWVGVIEIEIIKFDIWVKKKHLKQNAIPSK